MNIRQNRQHEQHEGGHDNHHEEHNHHHHNKHEKKIKCPTEIHEDIDFTVPYEARGQVRVGEIHLECGPSSITRGSGGPEDSKHLELKHRISVRVPVDFFAEVKVGKGRVEFDS